MATLLPLQFRRQYAGPMDEDEVFSTSAARLAYLNSPRRFAGQIVGDAEVGLAFILNAAMNAWVAIGSSGPTGPTGPTGATGAAGTPTTGMAMLALANVFTKAQTVTPVALTDAAIILTDASLSNTFTVVLAGNRTLGNPTNLQNGVILNWRIKQDATGTRTLAYGSKFKWPAATAPVLSTAVNAVDFMSGQYFSDTDTLICTMLKGIA